MIPPARCILIASHNQARAEMERIGVDPVGVALMAPKQFHRNLKLTALTPPQANILKQELLALGGEAAVSKGVVSCRVPLTDAIVSATHIQLKRLIKKLKGQPYGLKEVALSMEQALENMERQVLTLKGPKRQWTLSGRTLLMGVLNVTPDSFSDGGEYNDPESAAQRALEMVEEGADFIDVGGESTRPGAGAVEEDEELKRVMPVVGELVKSGLVVSIDTTKAAVARAALDAGAEMVNDVSALTRDKLMAGVVAQYKAAIILMHSRGTPGTMQSRTDYEDLMGEVFGYLSERIGYAVDSGIDMEATAIDPGIGFAKSVEGNLEIIRRLGELKSLGRPILVGTSRKSFIGKTLGGAAEAGAGKRLSGTLSIVAASVLAGAQILRVHDVKEAKEAAAMADALKPDLSTTAGPAPGAETEPSPGP